LFIFGASLSYTKVIEILLVGSIMGEGLFLFLLIKSKKDKIAVDTVNTIIKGSEYGLYSLYENKSANAKPTQIDPRKK
jgi:hypothetical protein